MKISPTIRAFSACLFLLLSVRKTSAYALEGLTWPAGSKVVMQLGLGPTTIPLQDGMDSWDASAADALDIWNGYLDFISISSVSSPIVPQASGDGLNSVFFANTIFGDSFEEGTLAITVLLNAASPTETGEADVVVNSAYRFNSYRGPEQPGLYDLHRIVLHEFGHVLGLDHVTFYPPGQALMEPIISDFDHLGADDVDGVRSLYGATITNLPNPVFARQDDAFSFNPSSNNKATSYTAVNLPPGITIDPSTGQLSGKLASGGNYGAVLTAHGPTADAFGTIEFEIAGFENVPGLVRIIPRDALNMVADPIRPRIYAGSSQALDMIDTETFAITQLLPGDQRSPLSVSADGSSLLLVQNYTYPTQLKKIDLTSLQSLPPVMIPSDFYPTPVLEGLEGRDYGAGTTGIHQFDAATGTLQNTFALGPLTPEIAMSPDRSTLFVVQSGTLSTYDISGSDPVLLRSFDGTYLRPIPSSDGELLYTISTEGAGYLTQAPVPDLMPEVSFGVVTAGYGVDVVMPFTDAIYQSHYTTSYDSGAIFVYDPATLQQTINVDFGGLSLSDDINDPSHSAYQPINAIADHSGKNIFVFMYDYGLGTTELWVFSTDFESFPPPPIHPTKSLLNISTRARVETGEDAMIGGFIVQGPNPKKVLIRGIGPSLPLTGALSNPVLDLYDSSSKLLASNDNWTSDRLNIIGSQLAPSSERESAILVTLEPGAYTAVVRDLNNQPGLALVEVYDLDPKDSLLANISTRGKVETADNVMIGGFIIGGVDATKVLVRAIGPSLASKGIAQPLVDPVLELHDGSGNLISTNDNWRSTQQAEIIATGIPPIDDRESAIVASLQPSNYTTIVRGQNYATGVALVEVYNLDSASLASK